jgi:hypothetical protein
MENNRNIRFNQPGTPKIQPSIKASAGACQQPDVPAIWRRAAAEIMASASSASLPRGA